MARIPKKDSIRDLVCRSVLRHGPMKIDQIVSHFQALRASIVKEATHQMHHYGALELVNDVYHLADYMVAHYAGAPKKKAEPEVVLPVRAFKPWSGKYDPLNSLRRDEIRRDVGFKTGGISFSPWSTTK
jgi:hypothetical protein